ncbi:unnamed protein product [marine sediment metagenome]|uniref:HNH nuclease domain-containing protein n=1 Tax=marine sediment metagenome TaxID=412755 RepID=X0VUR6_9ZZZZ
MLTKNNTMIFETSTGDTLRLDLVGSATIECENCYQESSFSLYGRSGKDGICDDCHKHSWIQFPTCCYSPDYEVVKFKTTAGYYRVVKQCQTCGKGDPLGIKVKDYDLSILRVREKVENVWERFDWWRYNQDITDRENGGTQKELYHAWLETDEWKEIRSKVLDRDRYTCQCCLVRAAEQVHHKSYQNYAGKSMLDIGFNLVSVCRKCHLRLHEQD